MYLDQEKKKKKNFETAYNCATLPNIFLITSSTSFYYDTYNDCFHPSKYFFPCNLFGNVTCSCMNNDATGRL